LLDDSDDTLNPDQRLLSLIPRPDAAEQARPRIAIKIVTAYGQDDDVRLSNRLAHGRYAQRSCDIACSGTVDPKIQRRADH
jgi:hypothetical protein